MIVPNKFYPYNKSIISKISFILESIETQKGISISNIYKIILAIDTLNLLDKISVDYDAGVIYPC